MVTQNYNQYSTPQASMQQHQTNNEQASSNFTDNNFQTGQNNMSSQWSPPQASNPRAPVNDGFGQGARSNVECVYANEDPDKAEQGMYELLGGTGPSNTAVNNPINTDMGVGCSYGGRVSGNPSPNLADPSGYSGHGMQYGRTRNDYGSQGGYPAPPPSRQMQPGQGNYPSRETGGYANPPYPVASNQPTYQPDYNGGYAPNPPIPNNNQIPNIQGQGYAYPVQPQVGMAAPGSSNVRFGWAVAGAAAGAVGGYILGNVPGAAMGAVAGARVGHERDISGQPVFATLNPEAQNMIIAEGANILGGWQFPL